MSVLHLPPSLFHTRIRIVLGWVTGVHSKHLTYSSIPYIQLTQTQSQHNNMDSRIRPHPLSHSHIHRPERQIQRLCMHPHLHPPGLIHWLIDPFTNQVSAHNQQSYKRGIIHSFRECLSVLHLFIRRPVSFVFFSSSLHLTCCCCYRRCRCYC